MFLGDVSAQYVESIKYKNAEMLDISTPTHPDAIDLEERKDMNFLYTKSKTTATTATAKNVAAIREEEEAKRSVESFHLNKTRTGIMVSHATFFFTPAVFYTYKLVQNKIGTGTLRQCFTSAMAANIALSIPLNVWLFWYSAQMESLLLGSPTPDEVHEIVEYKMRKDLPK
eukprot:Awhi_evm1s2204